MAFRFQSILLLALVFGLMACPQMTNLPVGGQSAANKTDEADLEGPPSGDDLSEIAEILEPDDIGDPTTRSLDIPIPEATSDRPTTVASAAPDGTVTSTTFPEELTCPSGRIISWAGTPHPSWAPTESFDIDTYCTNPDSFIISDEEAQQVTVQVMGSFEPAIQELCLDDEDCALKKDAGIKEVIDGLPLTPGYYLFFDSVSDDFCKQPESFTSAAVLKQSLCDPSGKFMGDRYVDPLIYFMLNRRSHIPFIFNRD